MKLVIIGGASAYTPDIIAGLLKSHNTFAGWELALHDIDAPHLETVARLTQAMVRGAGADLTVTHTTDRAKAVSGARFILTQPRVGGFPHRRLDERIPLKHGVIGQETLGPGGFSFAWRSIPLMLEIVEEVQRLAPEAWIINYSNPVGMVTEAVIRTFPDARYIGLCDMPTGVQWAVGKVLRVDFHQVVLDYAGINHGGWCQQITVHGQDVMPRLHRWAQVLGLVAGVLPLGDETGALRLFRRYGMIPDPYLRYYYYKDRMLRQLLRSRRTRAEEIMAQLPALYGHYEAASAAQKPVLTMHRGHQSHSDLASQVIIAMATGSRSRFVIQQRNGGTVPNLPAEGAAQFSAWVDDRGWEPIPMPPIPEATAALIQQVQAAEALNVTAALKGDRHLAVDAVAANPLVPNRVMAETLVEELLEAHRDYLPQFW